MYLCWNVVHRHVNIPCATFKTPFPILLRFCLPNVQTWKLATKSESQSSLEGKLH